MASIKAQSTQGIAVTLYGIAGELDQRNEGTDAEEEAEAYAEAREKVAEAAEVLEEQFSNTEARRVKCQCCYCQAQR